METRAPELRISSTTCSCDAHDTSSPFICKGGVRNVRYHKRCNKTNNLEVHNKHLQFDKNYRTENLLKIFKTRVFVSKFFETYIFTKMNNLLFDNLGARRTYSAVETKLTHLAADTVV